MNSFGGNSPNWSMINEIDTKESKTSRKWRPLNLCVLVSEFQLEADDFE